MSHLWRSQTMRGNVLYDGRLPLQVEQGGLGLKQSEAFFLHMRQLPTLVEQALASLHDGGYSLASIGVSDAPLNDTNSYMPVFMAGLSTARMLAASLRAPLHTFSHQQGHLRAAEIGNDPFPKQYLGMHLSGGTTQVVQVEREGWSTSLLCETSDISAGQWIDRIGVLMGYAFPAGPSMELLARTGKRMQKSIGIPLKDGMLSFSGAEAEVKRRLLQGYEHPDIALEIFLSISRAICKAIVYAHQKTGLTDALIAGGVAANSIVRQEVMNSMAKRCKDMHICFAKREYAGDNAVGVALLSLETEGKSCSTS